MHVSWYRSQVSDTPWTRLQAPFPRSAVTWDPLDVSESGDAALVMPRLRRADVCGRLDAVVGVHGWSLTVVAVEGGIGSTVRVGDVVKSAVADHGRVGRPSAERTADLALARAVELFGLHAPVRAPEWVPYDAESGMVLDDVLADDGLADAVPANDVHDERGGNGAVHLEVDAERASAPPRTAPDDADGAAPDVLRAAAEARGLTAEGQRMIDRLLERLKEEGQGLAAARLLVRHGGYGNDPASARELYAALRALLVRSGAREESGA